MKFKDLFYKGLNWASDHSAEICTGVAVVTSVSAVVMTVKATNDAIPELETHKFNIDFIKNSMHDDGTYLQQTGESVYDGEGCTDAILHEGDSAVKEYRKDLAKEYGRTALTLAKHYAIPVALEITAVATIISSNKISRKKNAALAGSLTCLQAAYDRYRQNVIEAVGEDKERDIRLGLHKEKITEEETDENGKAKKVKKEVNVVDPDKVADPWCFIFDEKSDFFNKTKGVNRQTLMIKQANWNDWLVQKKRVFVNEVLEDLGLACYCTPMGQVYGWIYDDSAESTRQNCIKFNIEDDLRFMGNYDPSVMIRLEPDGYILDDAFINKPVITKKAWAGANY